ncbi:hypothetical protein L596_013354 [Steinernema carpocapsae]|uniref:Uncharacterized protein n=1 Tax=Steinernema carpocapsae TaxID=34508 RepID=A0A4U5NZW0_STECR|nr:hypothetical protein L596_013354 [Steinernema carpocapsae]
MVVFRPSLGWVFAFLISSGSAELRSEENVTGRIRISDHGVTPTVATNREKTPGNVSTTTVRWIAAICVGFVASVFVAVSLVASLRLLRFRPTLLINSQALKPELVGASKKKRDNRWSIKFKSTDNDSASTAKECETSEEVKSIKTPSCADVEATQIASTRSAEELKTAVSNPSDMFFTESTMKSSWTPKPESPSRRPKTSTKESDANISTFELSVERQSPMTLTPQGSTEVLRKKSREAALSTTRASNKASTKESEAKTLKFSYVGTKKKEEVPENAAKDVNR